MRWTRALVLLVVVLIIFSDPADAGKKKKKKKVSDRETRTNQPKKPADVESAVWCHACEAMVDIMNKQTLTRSGKRKGQVEVAGTVADICAQKNYPSYDYIPPKMVRACEGIIDGFEEEFESKFIGIDKVTEEEVCGAEGIRACVGVKKPSQKGPDIYVNNEPQHMEWNGDDEL